MPPSPEPPAPSPALPAKRPPVAPDRTEPMSALAAPLTVDLSPAVAEENALIMAWWGWVPGSMNAKSRNSAYGANRATNMIPSPSSRVTTPLPSAGASPSAGAPGGTGAAGGAFGPAVRPAAATMPEPSAKHSANAGLRKISASSQRATRQNHDLVARLVSPAAVIGSVATSTRIDAERNSRVMP